MKCRNCGEEIGSAKTCEKCGALQDETSETVIKDVLAADSTSDGEGKQADNEQNADRVRRFCRKCGSGLGDDGACPKCGILLYEEEDKENDAPEESRQDKGGGGSKKSSSLRVIAINLGIAAALICAIAFVVWYGVDTAYHWEKVDDPGTMIERRTGYYFVTMDDEPVCYVGQDWTDCINAYIAEYNNACTLPMPPEDGGASRLGASASTDGGVYHQSVAFRYHSQGTNQTLCNRYSNMISEMQAEDGPGYYVTSLGSWGHLHTRAETERVRVGYESHDAVCYYGFLGECPEGDEDK